MDYWNSQPCQVFALQSFSVPVSSSNITPIHMFVGEKKAALIEWKMVKQTLNTCEAHAIISGLKLLVYK